jgi:hypothetical protein
LYSIRPNVSPALRLLFDRPDSSPPTSRTTAPRFERPSVLSRSRPCSPSPEKSPQASLASRRRDRSRRLARCWVNSRRTSQRRWRPRWTRNTSSSVSWVCGVWIAEKLIVLAACSRVRTALDRSSVGAAIERGDQRRCGAQGRPPQRGDTRSCSRDANQGESSSVLTRGFRSSLLTCQIFLPGPIVPRERGQD